MTIKYVYTEEGRFLPPLGVDGNPGLTVPMLYCPFMTTSPPSEHADAVQRDTLAWLCEHRIVSGTTDPLFGSISTVGRLAAQTYLMAQRETLSVASDWTTLFFLVDDLSEKLGDDSVAIAAANSRYLSILSGSDDAVVGPVDFGLRDVRNRIRALASERWLRRFIHRVEEWLNAHLWEARNRATGTIPDVSTYVHMRQFSIGMYFEFLLSELTDGYELPPALVQHEVVMQLARHASNQIAWANDVMTIGKELRQGEIHNLVLSLCQHEHMGLQQAIDRVAAMHNDEVRQFQALAGSCSRYGLTDAAVQCFIAALQNFMRGHIEWGYSAERYRPMGSVD